MADKKHLTIAYQGGEAWNVWRGTHPEIRPDLNGVDFTGVDLGEANFSNTDLRQAIFVGAKLDKADLRGANLEGAPLVGASLIGGKLSGANLSHAILLKAKLTIADLRGVDLTGTSLVEADLRGAILNNAIFTEANFHKAKLGRTTFVNNDLSKARGLDTAIHTHPSSIGIDSLYLSKGRIPHEFLRGAGVPENLVTYLHSLTGTAFDLYSCFISYSSKDQIFVRRLYTDLQNAGVRCWFAPKNLRIGEQPRTAIDDAIRKHEKLLVILSKHSIGSQWVEKEVEAAFEQERKQEQRMIIPVMLDQAVMKVESGWPADIRRTRTFGDFRRWRRPEVYQNAFRELLRSLNVSDT